MTPELYRLFLISQMHNDGLPQSTINFFMSIFPEMKVFYRMNIAQMGRVSSMTRESARRHVNILESSGYLLRMGYKGWRLNEPLLRNPDLVSAVKKLTAA